MPRPPRLQIPGDVVHIASRGVAQGAIFLDDIDRQRFVDLLAKVVIAQRWRCLTYCLLGNHYHVVVQLREANLSLGMQRLNGDYGRWFNDRHHRVGHLFQGRFWAERVRRDPHLLELARYVALNAWQANLCATVEEWAWSAHRALLGLEHPRFVDVAATLSYFGGDPNQARASYAAFVADGIERARGVRPPVRFSSA